MSVLYRNNAAPYIAEPAARNGFAGERSEGFHQGEGCVAESIVSDGVLLGSVLDVYVAVRVCADGHGHHRWGKQLFLDRYNAFALFLPILHAQDDQTIRCR